MRFALPLLTLVGCGGCANGATAVTPGLATSRARPDTAAPVGQARFEHSISLPRRVEYVRPPLGVSGQSVKILLKNVGDQPAPVSGLKVSFEAKRSGVSFPCREHTQGSMRVREPALLTPHASFTFERDLDCTLPLPGAYEIAVRGEVAGTTVQETLPLDLVDTRGIGPKALPRGGPEVHATLVGNGISRPLPVDAWIRGEYQALVALINGTLRPVSLVGAQLGLSVYRVGDPLPCVDTPVTLRVAKELQPGSVFTQAIPVTCILNKSGDYDVVGKLSLGGGSAFEIGRFRLQVSEDPRLYMVPAPD